MEGRNLLGFSRLVTLTTLHIPPIDRLPRPSTCGSLAVRAGPSCLVTGLLEAAVDAYPGKG